LQRAGNRTVINLLDHDNYAKDLVDIAQVDTVREYMLRIRCRENRLITRSAQENTEGDGDGLEILAKK
jgi:hypothetical protein